MTSNEGRLARAKEAAGDVVDEAQDAAATATRHPAAMWINRVGYVANGLVHALIGAIAIAVAFGAGGDAAADQGGAMRALRESPLGGIALWCVGIALCLLALQQFVAAVAASRAAERKADAVSEDGAKGTAKQAAAWKEALRPVGRGIAYAVVGATALVTANGGESDGEQTTESVSGDLMSLPIGPWLVGLAGLIVAAVGIAFVVRGVRRTFLDDIHPPARMRKLVETSGAIGYAAKGVAVVLIGVLFVIGAITTDPEQTGGLDGALHSLTTVTGGVFVLVAIGVGLIAYGVFCCARGAWERP